MEKRFSLWQLLGFAGVASAVIAGLALWLSYTREPRLTYERTDIAIPAPPTAETPFTLSFLRLQFQNIGKRPAQVLQLTINASRPIAHFDFFPKLSGMDQFRSVLSADKKTLDLEADRFPAAVKITVHVWLSGEGTFEEPRFTSMEASTAERVDSLDLALVPWYKKRAIWVGIFVLLLNIGVASYTFREYRSFVRKKFEIEIPKP